MFAFDPLRTSAALLEAIMLDELRTVIDSVPVSIVAFLGPPVLWAKAAWATPNLKTYRHRISGSFSLLAGVLMATSVLSERHALAALVGAAISLTAMIGIMLWPPQRNVD